MEESINLKELKKTEESVLLVEGDIIVPDISPDISKILMTDAICAVTNKEFTGNKINISGNISVNILYLPEQTQDDGEKIKSICTKLDYSDSFAFSEESPFISVKADIVSINCALLNSRKVNVKITMKLITKVYTKNVLSFLKTEASTAETKTKMISLHTTAVDTQKEFVFTETLEVPAAKCDIEEILKTNVNIIKGECRVAEDKILLKGTVNINTLYAGMEESYILNNMEHELPFSEILDVDGLREEHICNVTYDVKNVSTTLQNDSNGDPREIVLSVTINANITASKIYDTEILEDIYFPNKKCEVKSEKKTLKKSIWEGTSRETFKNICTLPKDDKAISRIFSVASYPVINEYITNENSITIKGTMTFSVLYLNSENNIDSHTCRFNFSHQAQMDEDCENINYECDISALGTNFNICSDNEIEVRTNIEFFIRLTEDFTLDVITECNAYETETDNSYPQIIIYFVQNGDTLWDIAKRYNTTVKRIKEINKIETITSAGEKLLIPAR